jgi:hydrophobic/amphiphilic exporter-1 (mainly G- bacteria), HAE1 family
MTLTELAIKRSTSVVMFFTAIAVVGVFLYGKLPVDLLPSMNWPWVTVVTVWPGAGPKEIETMVTKPIEDAVISLNKLKHIRSYNQENVSVVVLEFEMSADADQITQETQRVVSSIRAQLPDDAEEPQFYKADIGSLPILRIAVTSKLSGPDLFTLIDQKIRPRLEQVDGVGQVTISGAEEREIEIAVDPAKLRPTACRCRISTACSWRTIWTCPPARFTARHRTSPCASPANTPRSRRSNARAFPWRLATRSTCATWPRSPTRSSPSGRWPA